MSFGVTGLTALTARGGEVENESDEQRMSVEDAVRFAARLHQAGRHEEAEDVYRQILAALPDQPDTLNFLALLRYQRGDRDEAMSLLTRATEVAPDFPSPHLNLGNLHMVRHELDQALTCYERALELEPGNADALNNLGIVYRRTGLLDKAIDAFRRSIASNPDLIDAAFNLGQLLLRRGASADAIAHLESVIERKPDYFPAYAVLGDALLALGRIDEAADVFRRMLKIAPEHPVALHRLAACTGDAPPPRASDEYVRDLFDDAADEFDAHLAQLDYRAPGLVADAVTAELGADPSNLAVLDAGCGTGACGALLRHIARELVGVDLSGRMLARARARGVFDELFEEELTTYLQSQRERFDLIVSSDTLNYFGDLTPVLQAASGGLRAGGLIGFTLELASGAAPGITPSGRYAHTEAYAIETLQSCGFDRPVITRAELRTEQTYPVEGLIVIARKA